MDMLPALAIIAFAALMHASFQLGVSVLTLLNGHALSRTKSHDRSYRMTTSFVLGAMLTTILLLCATTLAVYYLGVHIDFTLAWSVACGILVGTGLAVWLLYYRNSSGTALWLPRGFARFLSDRARNTQASAEAFSLGATSVLSELLFIFAPIFASALALVTLPNHLQVTGIILYALISLLPLIIVWMLIGGGHPVSTIQRWREKNKRFLQFAAGSGLIVLGFFIYTFEIFGTYRGGL